MQKYDLTVLAKAEDAVVERMEKIVKVLGGKVTKTVEMGKKPLAYQIKKAGEAQYVNFIIELTSEAVVQLRRKLAVDKELLRHMLLKVN